MPTAHHSFFGVVLATLAGFVAAHSGQTETRKSYTTVTVYQPKGATS